MHLYGNQVSQIHIAKAEESQLVPCLIGTNTTQSIEVQTSTF